MVGMKKRERLLLTLRRLIYCVFGTRTASRMENKKEPRVLGGFEPKALIIKTHNKKHQRKKKKSSAFLIFFR